MGEAREKVCRCGCGEKFTPRKKNQAFVNSKHKDAWHNGRKGGIVREIKDLSQKQIEEVLKFIRKLKTKEK